jgi:hypothetical protein
MFPQGRINYFAHFMGVGLPNVPTGAYQLRCSRVGFELPNVPQGRSNYFAHYGIWAAYCNVTQRRISNFAYCEVWAA